MRFGKCQHVLMRIVRTDMEHVGPATQFGRQRGASTGGKNRIDAQRDRLQPMGRDVEIALHLARRELRVAHDRASRRSRTPDRLLL